MSISIYMKGYYEEKPEVWLRKNKPNSKPITNAVFGADWIPAFAGMTNMEFLHGGKFYGYLKKQSQFVPGVISAKSCLKEDYGNIPVFGAKKNKAKQSQFSPCRRPKTVEVGYETGI